MNREQLIRCINSALQFKQTNTIYYNIIYNSKSYTKLACFDLDHTLIKPKSGSKLPKNKDDYMYMPYVINKLNELYEKDYRIVIFTNQAGKYLESVLQKIQNILLELMPIKLDVMVATKDDYYRKPHTGAFELYLTLINQNIKDFSEIFYCGDAAGRPTDFAYSDYAFAYNLSLKYSRSIKFYLPEEIFENKIIPFTPICKDNSINYITECSGKYKLPIITKENPQEIVVMCGLPGSGKSSFAFTLFGLDSRYSIVSKDKYKTKAISTIKKAIKEGFSVIIDDTNVNNESRQIYIKIAQEHKLFIRCISMDTPLDICKHLNDMRIEISKGIIVKVPELVYNILNKKYTRPKISEGFNSVIYVPFVLSKDIPKPFVYIYNTLIYC